ncbi:hypothetical protein ACQEVY_12430 [Streptomyces sp. CA-288835]|uniref:hypothetical protein n=1 Tax=Streptomyces sp. CA-288835 TaxID=3240069 RepID=UPI003D91E19D
MRHRQLPHGQPLAAALPQKTTWYLATNLLAIVRLHGLRPWIEHIYKQIKDEQRTTGNRTGEDIAEGS